MPKLAESRFVTGPRDELAVVDVYEVTENAVRNRAESLLDDLTNRLAPLFTRAETCAQALCIFRSYSFSVNLRIADILQSGLTKPCESQCRTMLLVFPKRPTCQHPSAGYPPVPVKMVGKRGHAASDCWPSW